MWLNGVECYKNINFEARISVHNHIYMEQHRYFMVCQLIFVEKINGGLKHSSVTTCSHKILMTYLYYLTDYA
ncbi:hypothetical protein HanPI659440_Chr02g0035191 [Helianthus annuus]|nr:hypothetical protein HanPI659440_Chr02g0035191 [Helianthus annuus]